MSLRWYQKLVMRIIDSGEIPRHIAIIMDGNRRYAKKNHLDSVGLGHQMGADKLKQIIQWLSTLNGIEILTVYAFSLHNWKRSESELTSLMDLAEKTFKEMADHPEFFVEHRCRVAFIGQTDMIEDRVKLQMRRVEAATPLNAQFVLNICVCYTAHDEIERARDKCLKESSLCSYENIYDHLDVSDKPDLLIRTSGVYRMSNFLLMQCENTPIYVTDTLWPELTFYEMTKILLKYQMRQVV